MPSTSGRLAREAVTFIFCYSFGLTGTLALAAEAPNQAKNLARASSGATIVQLTNGTTADARDLALDDETLDYDLPKGQSTFVIKLRQASALERFVFVNEGGAAEGTCDVSVASTALAVNDAGWNTIRRDENFSGKRVVEIAPLGAEAKFVRLNFNVRKSGRIGSVSLYGERTLRSFAARHLPQTDGNTNAGNAEMLKFNFANEYAGTRVRYVSSGDLAEAGRAIDDDVATAFQFDSNDANPAIVLEFAKTSDLRRVSSRLGGDEADMDVYLLNELGSDPANVGDAKPVAHRGANPLGEKVALDFSPQAGRFLVLRWHRKHSGTTFEVAEVGAFAAHNVVVLELGSQPAFAGYAAGGGDGRGQAFGGVLVAAPSVVATSP